MNPHFISITTALRAFGVVTASAYRVLEIADELDRHFDAHGWHVDAEHNGDEVTLRRNHRIELGLENWSDEQ